MVVPFRTLHLLPPIVAVGPIAQEKKQLTLELLLTTQEQPADIILGKWLAALAELIILFLACFPLLIWMQAFLNDAWWTMTIWFACVCLVVLPLTAWPLLAAVLVRRQGVAIIAAYVGNIAMVACMLLLFTDAQLGLWHLAVYDGAFWVRFASCVVGPTVLFLTVAMFRLRAANEALQQPSGMIGPIGNRPPVGEQPIVEATVCKRRVCHGIALFPDGPRIAFAVPRASRRFAGN